MSALRNINFYKLLVCLLACFTIASYAYADEKSGVTQQVTSYRERVSLECNIKDNPFPLHESVKVHNYQSVRCLLNQGFPINELNNEFVSALWLALYNYDGKNALILEYFLGCGLNWPST